MPVQKSDILAIPDEGEWQTTPICWRQRLKECNKNYFRIEFTNTRDGEPEKTNYLFVSEEKLEDFKTSKIEKADAGFKLTVDDHYMFGQQKGGRARFLVYQEKDREIMQHRFLEGTLVALSQQATLISEKLGYGEVRLANMMMAGSIGDRLRTWKDA